MSFFQRPARSLPRRPRFNDTASYIFSVGDEIYVTCGAFCGMRVIAAIGFDYYAVKYNGRHVYVPKAICDHPSQEPRRIQLRQWEQDREDREARELVDTAGRLSQRPMPFGYNGSGNSSQAKAS